MSQKLMMKTRTHAHTLTKMNPLRFLAKAAGQSEEY